MALRAAWPAIRDRESAGGVDDYRDRGGRARARGWVHASAGRHGERDQRNALRKAKLQFPPRHRAGRRHHARAQCHGGASVVSSQNGSRAYRLCQGQSGQDQSGIARRGNLAHMARELFKAMTGTDIVQVQYRGNAPALTDLLAGQVQLGFDTMPASIEYIRAGKLRALAVGTLARSEALPDVPTVNEFVPGYESSGYFGLGVPKDTPLAIVERLNGELNAGLADSALKARLAALGAMTLAGSPADFGKLIADET